MSVTCPCCQGHGTSEVLAGERFYATDCPTCEGTGKVSEEVAESRERGLKLQQKRMRQGWTLRAYASCVGVSPTGLSLMEQGRIPIPEWVWAGLSK